MARSVFGIGVYLVVALLAAVGFKHVNADANNHNYEPGDEVDIFFNHVGPLHNPSETYPYYTKSFCRVREENDMRGRFSGFGDIFEENTLVNSDYTCRFRHDTPKTYICAASKQTFGQYYYTMINKNYYFSAIVDDLPLYGMLGKKNPKDPLDRVQPVHGLEKEGIYTNEVWLENHRMTPMDLYTHQQYEFEYNGNHIVGVKVNMLEPVKITKGDMDNIGTFNMYYSVKWVENKNYTFHNRFERYLDKQFFEHKIHWFAIFNSFMMVIFLVGLVSLILMRTLRRDFQRYNADEEALELMEHDVNDETGWKLVHGDVFRPVENLMELTVLIGTGIQLTVLALLIIVFALFGELWVSRSAMISCTIFSWAFTSFVGGYVSGGMYARNDGDDWIKAFVVYATSFPSFCFVLGFFVNLVSIYWGALAQVSIFTIFILLLVWLLISFPLSLAGTVIGRNWAGSADLPCRVKRIPSPIPIVPIYLHPVVIAIFSGVLPFGSIFIELYFVMTSFWSYKIYYVYEFMLLSFIILIIVTACVSIVATYFLLNSENYHWQWTSYASGASISIYIYLYCIYYFMYKSHMDGWFQFIYFFGYSLMFAVGIGIMCGAIGFLASSVFVRRIYRNVKCD